VRLSIARRQSPYSASSRRIGTLRNNQGRYLCPEEHDCCPPCFGFSLTRLLATSAAGLLDLRANELNGGSVRELQVSRKGNCYVDILTTTIRAISGLSRQTPSLRITKSAGSNTIVLTKSTTARSTLGRSGSIKSNMNFDDPSLPSCIIPIVGS